MESDNPILIKSKFMDFSPKRKNKKSMDLWNYFLPKTTSCTLMEIKHLP